MIYDNRRKIIETQEFKSKGSCDMSNTLLDSKPLENINQCKTRRFISKFPFTLPFNKNNTNRSQTRYKTNIEVAVRNFIKAYYSTNNKFGLKGNEFRYIKDLISFINGISSSKDIKISTTSISKLKNRNMF